MDTRVSYEKIVKEVLSAYAAFYAQGGGQPLHPVFDDEHKSYMLLKIGWQGLKYIHSATIHLEILGDKIWIQSDHTEEGIATDLLEAGVPREDIVLGFRPPHIRKHTGFAVVETPA